MTYPQPHEPGCQCYECDCCKNKTPKYIDVDISGVVPRDNCSDCPKHNCSARLWQIPCVPCGWYLMNGCYLEEDPCVDVTLIQFGIECRPDRHVAGLIVEFVEDYGGTQGYHWHKEISFPFDCSAPVTFTSNDIVYINGNPVCDYSQATLIATGVNE